jgi:integrase
LVRAAVAAGRGGAAAFAVAAVAGASSTIEATAAPTATGIHEKVRAFHDLRHTAITNDAASGANPIAVMTKAGHSDMKTTKRYMHLAGQVFRDEAEALERRMLGAVESSTDLSEPQTISAD